MAARKSQQPRSLEELYNQVGELNTAQPTRHGGHAHAPRRLVADRAWPGVNPYSRAGHDARGALCRAAVR
jgi:hypothetical protein